MKLGFSTLSCPAWDLDTIIERALRYGYDGVDFRGIRDEIDVSKLPAFTQNAGETARRIRQAGLEVCGFSSGIHLLKGADAGREEALRYGQLCEAFSTPIIRVFAGRLEGEPYEQAVVRAAKALKALAEAVAPVWVGVETHDDWVRSERMSELLDRAGAENTCVIWDAHHTWRLAGETPSQTLACLGRRVRYVHVKDSLPAGDGSLPVLAGQGDVPWAQMVSRLRESGYDGYLTVEWEKRWHPDIADPDEALPAYAEHMRRLMV